MDVYAGPIGRVGTDLGFLWYGTFPGSGVFGPCSVWIPDHVGRSDSGEPALRSSSGTMLGSMAWRRGRERAHCTVTPYSRSVKRDRERERERERDAEKI